MFAVEAEEKVLSLMTNFEPFKVSSEGADCPLLFSLKIDGNPAPEYIEEIKQDTEGQQIICGHTADGDSVFEFQWKNRTAGCLVCSADYHNGTLHLSGLLVKAAVDNALMIFFSMATACIDTALFHAATVSLDGRAYMFLGKSGTGKSTHASLWIRHIAGSELVNDDNPAVRIGLDGTATVYGTPWSGKTPCYRNVSYPIGGIVLLSQAPFNRIERLTGIRAYAAVVPSISGKRWDSAMADGLHRTENTIVGTVPVWHLDCLPDEDAALLCWRTIAQ